jgi:choline dehydrogenase-like flavoprotein
MISGALNDVFDVCVIGGGPVGLAVALEAAEHGLAVVLLEAGSAHRTPAGRGDDEFVDPARHVPLPIAVSSGLGGTSRIWGGRCVPFDDVDLNWRAHVTDADWPVSSEEVSKYYPSAARLLGCGTADFDDTAASPPSAAGCFHYRFERWVKVRNTAEANRERLADRRNLAVREGHQVVGLRFEAQRLDAVSVLTSGGVYSLRARTFVVACGGIETTRILLAHQRNWPTAFGGKDGPLGRYYMGHLSGKIAGFTLRRPDDASWFDFHRAPDGNYIRRRILLGADTQRRQRLLNCAFWLDNPPFHNADHGNPLLSSVFLALAAVPIGRVLVPEAVRLGHIGTPPRAYGRHLLNIFRGPHLVISGAADIVRERFLADTPRPGFLVRNRGGRYAIHYHAEQLPNLQSRIRLADDPGAGPLPRLAIDLRYCRADAASVISSHAALDSALRCAGIGQLEYWQAPGEREDQVMGQAADGLHQIGTARMSRNPDKGVVDANLRVHGTANLFVASSAVFPSSGQANPTFLAVALASRLAEHLSWVMAAIPPVANAKA